MAVEMTSGWRRRRGWVGLAIMGISAGLVGGALIPMTLRDFYVPGTQIGDVPAGVIRHSTNHCIECHGFYDDDNSPYSTWSGSLMANAGRDPLFFAQMTTANQDVENVGYFCMRCHVPMSIVTGSAAQPDGSALGYLDQDGVTCHFCHAMVDPIYKPGVSPPEDGPILQAMPDVPEYYGNAMFVLDPSGLRRGPYDGGQALHTAIASPFHRTGDFCGTCHDVGNVAVSRQPDGTYRYNTMDQPSPSHDPRAQFPLERTYTEWKLSAFANGGVDMAGRFGGDGPTVVSTCQDCHMPKAAAQGCAVGPVRNDLARHDFAGASSWVLEAIAEHYLGDPSVDQNALSAGIEKAVSMLERAASVDLEQLCGFVRVRVINESGHKIPTGHIEGRRIWVNVQFVDDVGAIVQEYGRYDRDAAELDEASTKVYEMKVGLSAEAAAVTGYPEGVTTHMALADTIEKDNRIPPRGFDNAAYQAGGAPVVGAVYADGQCWDDTSFAIPPRAVEARVTIYYQTVTRHYIEALRDDNTTDDWGDILHDLWLATGKGAPVQMVSRSLPLAGFLSGDADGDGDVDLFDFAEHAACFSSPATTSAAGCECLDADADGDVDLVDFGRLQNAFMGL